MAFKGTFSALFGLNMRDLNRRNKKNKKDGTPEAKFEILDLQDGNLTPDKIPLKLKNRSRITGKQLRAKFNEWIDEMKKEYGTLLLPSCLVSDSFSSPTVFLVHGSDNPPSCHDPPSRV